MKNRKLFVRRRLGAAISMVLLVVLAACGCEMNRNRNLTLEKIAYDKSKENPVVYIKEDNDYVPYLVLTSDYGGNVLLLRENVLSEEMQYKPSRDGGGGALSGGWTYYDYSSYYEESSIDEFLNTEFLEIFSQDVQAAIVDTTIEVTDKESYDEQNWANATHMIERKVFLLSAVELGVEFSVGYNITKEGEPLKYFKNTVHSVKTAYKADGTAWPYWTRTPWIWETCEVTVIGVKAIGTATPDRLLGVRPAFCMEKDTIVQESDSVIEGKSVYVIE